MAELPRKSERLSSAVSKALEATRSYENQRSTILGQGMETLTAPLGGALASLIPNSWVLSALEAADLAAAYSVPAESPTADRDDLDACEAAALEVQAWAAGLNAASGGVSGFFGAAGVVADIPATLTLAARNVRAVGLAFGFDAGDEAEKAFRLRVLELATRQAGDARQDSIREIRDMARVLQRPEVRLAMDVAGDWLTEKVVERVARQLGVSLAGRKIGQVVPVIGSAVAATINASFQTDVSRAARYAYRLRWLMQQNLLPNYAEEESEK